MSIRLVAALGLLTLGLAFPASAEGFHFFWTQPRVEKNVSQRPSAPAARQVGNGNGLLAAFFGNRAKPATPQFAPDTMEKDALLAEKWDRKPVHIKAEFQPQSVRFTGYSSGTIVIDTKKRYLYFVESPFSARRYPIAVGREGMLFTGSATVGDKQEWPKWFPTKDMIKNEASKYARYADGMDGGLNNPLGARAIYLYQGKRDTYIRIHGTNQPSSIGSASSHGCFRMYNAEVMDLYNRVRMGAKVVVL